MASKTIVRLKAGKLALELNPSVGGSISSFEWIDEGAARGLLRRRNSISENVLEAASFPLVPYVNRIRGGHFRFRSRDVRMAPNMAGDPSPLHGQGWLGAWSVLDRGESGRLASRLVGYLAGSTRKLTGVMDVDQPSEAKSDENESVQVAKEAAEQATATAPDPKGEPPAKESGAADDAERLSA